MLGKDGAGVDVDAALLQDAAHLVEGVRLEQVLVDEEGLHGVARRGVVRLGIFNDLHSLVKRGQIMT